MADLHNLTARALGALIAGRQVSAREAAEAFLARIEVADPGIHAFLTVTREHALADAAAIDARLKAGERPGPLAGVPVALKDVLCTRGIRTTCGSRILERFVPPYDATVAARLAAVGTILLGKANCDEFAMGSSTENSAFGPTRNPWDPERVPGGSSGGSAAAVAAREAPIALGTDTGGSIRQPAALCGVVGLKPTYGRVSRWGLVAYASSLDQVGPLTRTVEDAALTLNAIAGRDPLDSTSADLPVPDYTQACRAEVRGLRLGVPSEFLGGEVDPTVAGMTRQAVDTLCEAGAEAEECSLPSVTHCLAAYYIIAPAEASSNLARYDGVRYGMRSREHAGHIGMAERTRDEGFGDEVKQRIMIGTYALSAGYYDAYYRRAQQVRTLIRRDFDRAFERYDLLVTPTSPTVAFRLAERADDPLAMKLADICTLPANMAGIPAISVPCGFLEGLPLGLQILGKAFDEPTLLRAAYTYEQATDWHRRRPPL
ncbi:MAG: Asp-tRNA(Asn)/Glu-tRNA(Gln) amidotransferase subunit GatA [Chthonomonadales bacterium]|nr:Asp-tRNA(Asn)/Glu-tRNA(Gln) amidotransferase subunit GatA [Chthonomonadales bacterium]